MDGNIQIKGFWQVRLDRARELHKTDPGLFWQRCLFWTFWFHLAFFAVGYGFREVMPPLCLIFLLLHYRYDWQNSVLRKLPVLRLFLCLWIMMVMGVVFSINPWLSFLDTATTFNKGLILPFLGMECVRSTRDLKRLVWASMLAFFWVGIDGIYQSITGYDFPMGYPMNVGRLTAAIGDYCVGNYMAMVLVPAMGVWYIFRQKLTAIASAVLLALLLVPGVYTLVGASARSGFMALLGCVVVWAVVLRFRHWKIIVPGCCLLALLALFVVLLGGTGRMSLSSFRGDGRWDLWRLALEVIHTWPMFGAGADMYNIAFRSLGLVPAHDLITIEHPHNLYLDILYSTGIVGACFGYTFLFGMLWWLAKNLWPRTAMSWQPDLRGRKESAEELADRPGCSKLYWQLTGLFALGYVCWLVNGITGHELYRMWWLGQAMLGLGVTLGAIVRGLEGEKPEVPACGATPAGTNAGENAAGERTAL